MIAVDRNLPNADHLEELEGALDRIIQEHTIETIGGVLESFYHGSNYPDPWGTIDDPEGSYRQDGRSSFGGIIARYDRTDGRNQPFYRDMYDLARIRSTCRMLSRFSSEFTSVSRILNSYTIGGEWLIKAKASGDDEAAQQANSTNAQEANKIINAFMKREEFLDVWLPELHDQSREDGEAFPALYPIGNGEARLRKLEVDTLWEPQNQEQLEAWLMTKDRKQNWDFGVHVLWDRQLKHFDYHKPVGYHFIFDESGRDWDYLPSWPQKGLLEDERCVVHMKRNVPSTAARGVSDFAPVLSDIVGNKKIRKRAQNAAAELAAILLMVEHAEGTTLSEAKETFSAAKKLAALARLKAQNSRANSAANVSSIKFPEGGGIISTGAGTKIHDPPMMKGAEAMATVARMTERSIGNRWNMPDWLATGDSSGPNNAMGVTSLTPFTKGIENDQLGFKRDIRRLFWRLLRIAHIGGRFGSQSWSQVVESLDIIVEAPNPEDRDPLKLAQTHEILYDLGVGTAQSIAAEHNVDPQHVDEQRVQQQQQMDMMSQAMGMQQPVPPGQEPNQDPNNPNQPQQPKPATIPPIGRSQQQARMQRMQRRGGGRARTPPMNTQGSGATLATAEGTNQPYSFMESWLDGNDWLDYP